MGLGFHQDVTSEKSETLTIDKSQKDNNMQRCDSG